MTVTKKKKKGDTVRPGLRVRPNTVLLSPAGWLRISEDLVDESLRGKQFRVEFSYQRGLREKIPGTLSFQLLEDKPNGHKGWNLCWYTNKTSRHPLVSIRGIFRAFGLSLPKRPKMLPVTKKDGWVTIGL